MLPLHSVTTPPNARAFPYVPVIALSFAAFVYVSYEMFAVGLITPLAADMHVPEARIGLLMTVYAIVVAVVTLPIIRLTTRVDKRLLLIITLCFLIAGAIVQALAVNYWMLGAARIIAAFTHGVFWALVAPVGARLAPGRAGKALSITNMGSTLALVAGSPLTTWLGTLLGWRVATWILALLTALCIVVLVLWMPALPALPASSSANRRTQPHRFPPTLYALIAYLFFAVTAVFSAYTYLGMLVERTAGASAVPLGLAGFGLVGLVVLLALSGRVDTRVIRMNILTSVCYVIAGCVAVVALLVSGGLSTVAHEGFHPTALSLVLIVVAIALWGGAYCLMPTASTTAFMRAGRSIPEIASATSVVTFQVGIAAGAALGAAAVERGFLGGTLLIMVVLACVSTAIFALWARPALR